MRLQMMQSHKAGVLSSCTPACMGHLLHAWANFPGGVLIESWKVHCPAPDQVSCQQRLASCSVPHCMPSSCNLPAVAVHERPLCTALPIFVLFFVLFFWENLMVLGESLELQKNVNLNLRVSQDS